MIILNKIKYIHSIIKHLICTFIRQTSFKTTTKHVPSCITYIILLYYFELKEIFNHDSLKIKISSQRYRKYNRINDVIEIKTVNDTETLTNEHV